MTIRRVTITGSGRGNSDPNLGGARIRSLNTNNGTTAPKHAVFNWKQEIVSESTTGTDDTYELLKVPTYDATVTIYVNGILQRQGVDYSIEDNVITFSEVLPAGYNIIAKYNAIEMER